MKANSIIIREEKIPFVILMPRVELPCLTLEKARRLNITHVEP